MKVVSGYVIQFSSLDGQHWTDWFRHHFVSEELARTALATLRLGYPTLTFRLITRETKVIEHEVKE